MTKKATEEVPQETTTNEEAVDRFCVKAIYNPDERAEPSTWSHGITNKTDAEIMAEKIRSSFGNRLLAMAVFKRGEERDTISELFIGIEADLEPLLTSD